MTEREEVMQILPHRDNMLLVDDVTEIDGTAVGHYHVQGDEFFLRGHFPEYKDSLPQCHHALRVGNSLSFYLGYV